MTELLRAAGLRFGYRGRALTGPVDFTLGAGEVLVVLGPNGAGKSTLFRTLLGTVPPIAGQVRWSGRALDALSPRQLAAEAAWVPQQPATAFDLDVFHYVLLGRIGRLPLGSAPGAADRQAVERALDRLGLARFRDRLLSRMSGGERQLAAIARALAQQSRALILDEPAASLDFGNQGRVLDTLSALAADGLGIVYSTHDPNHALRCGSKALLYQPGGGILAGPVSELLAPQVLSQAYGAPIEQAFTADGRGVLTLGRTEFRADRS
ncbi:ABC transporter ATP-binding protein [Burkholderiaceae bacterium FT117]|uniref:ABC transporter ATP-binding protein n=1 Tax=Zeimonas sediminis TaxID=2944268 RepID=UPI002342FF8E|nr:ABC transporter ATP-binding protein [Zeimonas sediminis]MCM5569682.1 ABC transporter ATP-binding protein [Zeimonas sediminis]